MTISMSPSGCSRGVWLAALLITATGLFSTRQVAAQACCTATGAGEFSVVGRCQDGVVAAQLSYERAWGSFDAQGRYSGLRSAEVDDVILAVGAGQRFFSPSLQVNASVPLRMQYRRFGDADGNLAARPGDAAFGVRWTALEDNMSGVDFGESKSLVPFLDAYVSLKVPTGRAPEDSETPTGADITGDGAWQAIVGAKATKFITRKHAVILQAGYAHRFARQIDHGAAPVEFEPGAEFSVELAWMQIQNMFWSWGGFGKATWTTEANEDGARIADSATRRVRFGAHLTHGIAFPFWEVTAAASVDAWWEDAGQNLPYAGPAATLTVRRSWF